ncbi:MAG TPA: energy-coupling factor transporter ATPase [Ruminococcaceae bacterium]|nr:energy-coupling factor transporter ATPase [Oscillospiraceae bacterium]
MVPILQVQHLTHTYSVGTPFQRSAVEDMSFDVYDGEFLGIIGHTGSGKSTLIQHLNGLLRPTSGQILLHGKDIWAEPKKIRDVRFQVGLVFQYPEYQLFEETCWKDIAYGPRNMGLDEEEITRRVKRAAEFVGLDEALLQKSPFELSGGQKRRVAIAGVMAMEPKILVLDEPAAGLDPEGRDTILSQIRNYHEQTGITVILVSHSMEDIARYANRVLVMSKAKVAMYDTVEKVFARAPELLELGLSVPQVTQVFLMLKAMGMEIDTDVYTVPYAVKTVLKAWNAKHPDKAVPLPQNHKTVQEGGAD